MMTDDTITQRTFKDVCGGMEHTPGHQGYVIMSGMNPSIMLMMM